MRLSGRLQLILITAFLIFCLRLFNFIMISHDVYLKAKFIRQTHPKPRFSKLTDNLFIFSSFVDTRNGNMGFPFFRIIAMMRFTHYKYYCLFKNKQSRVQIYAMSENHGRLYGAYILNCRIPERIIITTVKITLTDGNNRIDIVPTYYITSGSVNSLTSFTYTYNYTICLPFLYGHFYNTKYIIEMIEMHKLLGVQQITVYTTKRNLYSDVQKVLNYYEAESILDVIDIELPVTDAWNYAQLVFINDCLYRFYCDQNSGVIQKYKRHIELLSCFISGTIDISLASTNHCVLHKIPFRNMGRAKFVSFQDWDEIIIPIRNTDLISLFQNIFNASIASYQISTMYIHYDPNYPSLINSVQARSESLDKELTKCVLQPGMIFEQGIHHTSRVIQDYYLTLKLSDSEAILHHYVKNTDIQTSPVNTIPSRYGKILLRNCDTVLKKIHVQ